MNFTTHVRSVYIEASPVRVAAFTGVVPNLPRWTNFFVRVGEADGERYPVETKMGPATTWIEQKQTATGLQITICSLFGSRQEAARVYLEGVDGDTQTTFEIRLPANWTLEQVESQLMQLQDELYKLKVLVESEQRLLQVSEEKALV